MNNFEAHKLKIFNCILISITALLFGCSKNEDTSPTDCCDGTHVFEGFDVEDPLGLKPTIIIPNAITPNGDGLNDHFRIIATNVSSFHVFIETASGVNVYDSKNLNAFWDGFYNGNVQDGTYDYELAIKFNTETESRIYKNSFCVLPNFDEGCNDHGNCVFESTLLNLDINVDCE